jgi:arylsulfatase
VEVATPTNIVLISVDTLRPDHLSIYGYARKTSPQIDRFFAGATRYDRAYSTEANTSPSVVSMLSGRVPARHRVRLFYQRIPGDVPTLSDYLGAAGYQTAAVVSNVVLTREAIGLSTRFDHYDDFVDEREARLEVFERRASRTSDAAIAWLEGERDTARPYFLWVHYIDPHGPYRAPDDSRGARFRAEQSVPIDPVRVVPYQREDGLRDGARYIDRYDDEIAYADAEIGRLLQAIDEATGDAEPIVIFTADHGENMIEHDIYFNHGHQVWESIMRVPLLVRWPEREERGVDVPVSLVDLVPTLLDAVGYPDPEGALDFDGVALDRRRGGDAISLEASGKSGRGDPSTWAWRHHRALVSDDEKWFTSVDRDGKVIARGRYDLAADPEESEALPWHFGGKGNTLLRWFDADPDPAGIPAMALRGERLDGPKVAPGRTPEELRALRALGYIE